MHQAVWRVSGSFQSRGPRAGDPVGRLESSGLEGAAERTEARQRGRGSANARVHREGLLCTGTTAVKGHPPTWTAYRVAVACAEMPSWLDARRITPWRCQIQIRRLREITLGASSRKAKAMTECAGLVFFGVGW